MEAPYLCVFAVIVESASAPDLILNLSIRIVTRNSYPVELNPNLLTPSSGLLKLSLVICTKLLPNSDLARRPGMNPV